MGGKTKVDPDRAQKATISTAQTCKIVCPPDRHIPVSACPSWGELGRSDARAALTARPHQVEFNEIYMLARTGMTTVERIRFEKIAQLVESLYAQVRHLCRTKCTPRAHSADGDAVNTPCTCICKWQLFWARRGRWHGSGVTNVRASAHLGRLGRGRPTRAVMLSDKQGGQARETSKGDKQGKRGRATGCQQA